MQTLDSQSSAPERTIFPHANKGELCALPASRVWVECDPSAWRYNLHALREHVSPAAVAAVLKANAYGLGARRAAAALADEGIDYFAVSCLNEALQIADFNVPVLILGGSITDESDCIIQQGLTATVSDLEMVEHLAERARALGRSCRVHVKIDTGMGRLGFPVASAKEQVRRIAAADGVIVEGIYSHFASSGMHDEATITQYRTLAGLINELADEGIRFRYRHIANSTAIAGIPEVRNNPFNMVRSGLDLHGAHLSVIPRPYKTKPVLRALKTRLVSVRRLPRGATVSYGRTYEVTRPEGERIGVAAVGYADGYPRCLSNQGAMLVGGKRCPVVGRVCMDYTMLRLDDVPEAKSGDEVVVIGRQDEAQISLGEVARQAETIPYEILCSIGVRVQRQYAE